MMRDWRYWEADGTHTLISVNSAPVRAPVVLQMYGWLNDNFPEHPRQFEFRYYSCLRGGYDVELVSRDVGIISLFKLQWGDVERTTR